MGNGSRFYRLEKKKGSLSIFKWTDLFGSPKMGSSESHVFSLQLNKKGFSGVLWTDRLSIICENLLNRWKSRRFFGWLMVLKKVFLRGLLYGQFLYNITKKRGGVGGPQG